MSLESDLNRIATALEEIVKAIKNVPAIVTPPAPAKKKPGDPAPGSTATLGGGHPATAPALDPITGDPAVGAEIVYTQQQVHEALQGYMEKKGIEGPEGVKAVMIKHGASKVKPTITSIPAANYSALMAEITAVK